MPQWTGDELAVLSDREPDSDWTGLSRRLCWLTVLTIVVTFQVTAYKAGHVLGAAMFMVEIAGLRVLYTGDYSRLPDRHLPGAETPPEPPHICELLQSCFQLPSPDEITCCIWLSLLLISKQTELE